MRPNFRLIASLVVSIATISVVFAGLQVWSAKRRLRNDLERQAQTLAGRLQQAAQGPLERDSKVDLDRIVEEFGHDQHVAGVAIYDQQGEPLAITSGLRPLVEVRLPAAERAAVQNQGRAAFVAKGRDRLFAYALAFRLDHQFMGSLAVFCQTNFIEAQSARIWSEALARSLLQVILIALVTLLIVRWSMRGPIQRTAQWLRETRTGSASPTPKLPEEDLFKPLSREVAHLARSLQEARAVAEAEARLREAGESLWTADRLGIHVRDKLQGGGLFVVSNREPLIHVHRENSIEVMVPASGLVTAMEPILLACDGTWIAHGSGDADAEVVDAQDHLRVPLQPPQYTLRRVWLSKEEEDGYYYGFSNEGLWPLCHIAHTRPVFRAADWACYQDVNLKFADAALKEMAGTEQPFLLVQDYHFALLPRLIKAARPDARVAIFWHIPWPNPQAFGICPWQSELLDGLLGADLIGFHIQSHCNYFLETIDGALEARVDWEHFAVERGGHRTLVRPFPISVAFPAEAPESRSSDSVYVLRSELFKQLGVEAAFMGIGVDRVDYTKGILERFRAVERFLEKRPAYRGKFTFVQIGAPSRTHIKRYLDLLDEVEAEAQRINARFQAGRWKAVVFLKRHHSHEEIEKYYKAADVCMVTSLHDGMNLVAKEFVASRDDEQGALILSRFTGAARDLRDAMLVNPYDTEQLADAIALAIEMDTGEQRVRMQQMQRVVRENNVYWWAANLISELAEIRVERSSDAAAPPGSEPSDSFPTKVAM
ncbi:MAG TPA: trehalose-6-phosphate synthase [Terriglobia bacterium]|nr:trehalose-6-phosphate synthase [Terriglobia bacterium]